MIVAVTGGGGFVGWHTSAALLGTGSTVRIAVGSAHDPVAARAALAGCDRVVHIAGVNRADDKDVLEGNLAFAEQLGAALRACAQPPPVVVYANSTQSLGGGVYGDAKRAAAEVLSSAAADVGAAFIDVLLPNLFGEHGRARYNSVTATFSHQLARGETPTVEVNRDLSLLHAQDAADRLLGWITEDEMTERVHPINVSELLARLAMISDTYATGEIPDVSDRLNRDLFNTYRSYLAGSPIRLKANIDERGAFVELLRSHGGEGQISYSTTRPGATRGDHFHRRKIERFIVLSGRAVISLRRVLTAETITIEVDGDAATAVDMPTMWAHSIRNVGDEPLYTSFWSNELFDTSSPDTVPEKVEQ